MSAVDIWAEVRVGDLGDVFTGRTPPSERPSCFGEVYPFIVSGALSTNSFERLRTGQPRTSRAEEEQSTSATR